MALGLTVTTVDVDAAGRRASWNAFHVPVDDVSCRSFAAAVCVTAG